MPVVESFYGYVETTKDSLLLLEACRQGVLPRVTRRLQEQERHLVKSGAVFCFDENESGIKRWTDGLVWSPSRILGNFLIYRELGDRTSEQDDNTQQITSGLTLLSKRQREKSLLGSLRNSYQFKPNGLIKKSMSVVINGVHQHLVSYYNKEDVLNNKFRTPSTIPELATLTISTELLYDQHFRIPFLMEGETNGTKLEKRPTRQKRRSASYGFSNPPPRRQYSNSSSSSGNSNNSSNNSIVSDTSVGSSIPTPTLDTSFLSTPSTYNWTQDDLPQPDTTTLSSTKAAFMDPSPDTTLFSPPSCHHPPTHTISYSQHQPPFSIGM
ncbi:Gti1/Pac2 family-domain-containing protein [Chlamydoabsidia padenii]|nr:Gti1/Pac2 family-domain-containing protein [Chlamydoabsidia padenii]